jgi:hypothetical protein
MREVKNKLTGNDISLLLEDNCCGEEGNAREI